MNAQRRNRLPWLAIAVAALAFARAPEARADYCAAPSANLLSLIQSVDPGVTAANCDDQVYGNVIGTNLLNAELRFEFGDFAINNVFGIYDRGNPNNRLIVFQGWNSPTYGNSRTITQSGNTLTLVNPPGGGPAQSLVTTAGQFGFFMTSPLSGTVFTNNLLNPNNFDHVAEYVVGGNLLWLGFEDLPPTSGNFDRDFNDMVVRLIATPVPLPAAGWLLLTGLAGLGAVARRRRVAAAA